MAQPKSASAPPAARSNGRAIAFAVLFFFLLFTAVVLQSPLSKIRAIHVTGTSTLDPDRLIEQSGIQVGESEWKVNGAVVSAKLLAGEPQLSSVDVHLNMWSGTVNLAVTEKKVVAVWQQDGKWYRVLNDGTVLDQLPSGDAIRAPILSSNHMVSVTVGKPIADSAVVQACEQISKTSSDVLNVLSEVHIDDHSYWRYIVFTKDGYQIDVSGPELAAQLSLYLPFRQQLEQKHIGPGVIYLDQGVDYYRPFPNGNPSKGA